MNKKRGTIINPEAMSKEHEGNNQIVKAEGKKLFSFLSSPVPCSLLPAHCSLKLITLSGLDGSGKSTQLGLLKSRLEQDGKKVALFHAIEFSMANRITLALNGGGTFIPGTEKSVTRASSITLFLRTVFLAIDILRFRFFTKKLEQDGIEFLLSDRYFFDTVVNIEYLGGSVPKWIRESIPTPDSAFYLRITPEKIMNRARVPEQGSDYLRKKFDILEQKKSDWHLIEIDASLGKDTLSGEIFRQVRVA